MNTVFLTLRDKLADVSVQVTCTAGVVDSLPTPLVEGAQVVCHAKPSFYPNRGHALAGRARDPAGRRGRAAGPARAPAPAARRRGPVRPASSSARSRSCPRNVGLVTAQDSAAERDVLENGRRRWPGVRFTVKYAAMQGVHAAREVIEAVEALDRDPSVDVIVVARGGGSVEDLLPFSDEALVRAVHAIRTPLVSAIGHEPDSPILDLVADVRASTPTDAAKRVVPDVAEEAQRVLQVRERGRRAIRCPRRARDRTSSPRCAPARAWPTRAADWPSGCAEVEALRERARRTFGHRLDRGEDDLVHQLARVRALSPLATLRRGYAVLSDADGPGPLQRGHPRARPGPPHPGRRRPDRRHHHVGRPDRPDARRTLPDRPMQTPATRTAMTEDDQTLLRGRPRPAHRGRPHPRAGRHQPGGVARAVGARRGAGQGLPARPGGRPRPPRPGPRRQRRRRGHRRRATPATRARTSSAGSAGRGGEGAAGEGAGEVADLGVRGGADDEPGLRGRRRSPSASAADRVVASGRRYQLCQVSPSMVTSGPARRPCRPCPRRAARRRPRASSTPTYLLAPVSMPRCQAGERRWSTTHSWPASRSAGTPAPAPAACARPGRPAASRCSRPSGRGCRRCREVSARKPTKASTATTVTIIAPEQSAGGALVARAGRRDVLRRGRLAHGAHPANRPVRLRSRPCPRATVPDSLSVAPSSPRPQPRPRAGPGDRGGRDGRRPLGRQGRQERRRRGRGERDAGADLDGRHARHRRDRRGREGQRADALQRRGGRRRRPAPSATSRSTRSTAPP